MDRFDMTPTSPTWPAAVGMFTNEGVRVQTSPVQLLGMTTHASVGGPLQVEADGVVLELRATADVAEVEVATCACYTVVHALRPRHQHSHVLTL